MENKQVIEFVENVAKIKLDSNPTAGFELVKLKDRITECELGCGESVKNQVIERRLVFTPKIHWRIHCKNCHKFLHPDGVTLVSGAHKIQSISLAYFNDQNK